jgi:stearoyl-CoA desaturase (delta-9 desaturase)
MSRVEKYLNLTAVLLPFAAVIAAIALTWNSLVGWTDLGLFFGLYLVTAIGITVGYHRLFTHRAFDAPQRVKYALAIMGSMSVQGSLIDWVADHRKHHAFTDEEGDPHSPHGHGGGIKGAFKGLVYAHMGWLLETQGAADKRRFAKDLLDDPGLRKISKRFPLIVLFSLALPTALGFALTGTAMGALTGYIWGGLVRIFFVHHVTWSVNSVCHFFGNRRFDVEDQSTNVFWLAIPSLGESWHHNHHAFPRSAKHGLKWYEIDLSALIISGMEKVGWATNVVTIPAERQAARQEAGSAPKRERVPVA